MVRVRVFAKATVFCHAAAHFISVNIVLVVAVCTCYVSNVFEFIVCGLK